MEQEIIQIIPENLLSKMSLIFFDVDFVVFLILSFSLCAICLLLYGLIRKNLLLKKQRDTIRLVNSTQRFTQSLLENAPFTWVTWNAKRRVFGHDKHLRQILNLNEAPETSLDEFLACLEKDERTLLLENLENLDNAPFKLMVTIKPLEKKMTLISSQITDGKEKKQLIWMMLDQEPSHSGEDLPLQSIVDALPIPVWHRGQDGRLNYCNKTYASILETTPEIVVRESKMLWTGDLMPLPSQDPDVVPTQRVLKQHTIIDGARHLMEFSEKILNATKKNAAGFALDLTEADGARKELERHTEAQRDMLEQLSAGVVIYGSDKRLKFFNHAYVRMFDMDEKWMHTEPFIGEVLEDLRARRLLTEQADFPAYKAKQIKLCTSLLSPFQELIHLPDERTVRMVAAPHPMGGVFFIFEDVTDSFNIERQANTQIAVQKVTLDHLYEGVAVFASDNRLKLSNPSFGRIWRLPKESLAPGRHISELVEEIKDFFEHGGNWLAYKRGIIDNLTDRVPKNGRLNRRDGSVLEFSYVPLPDGAHLLSYTDVSDSHRIEKALRERNEALEAADQLKSEFLSNVSYELKAPLNTIIGFTEILSHQYFGDLNKEQNAYTKGVLESAQQLLRLVNDIIDLATIEAGHMSLNLQPVEIDKLLNSVLNMVEERAKSQQLKISMTCAKDFDNFVADERRLKQALFNILNNSIKYTPEGGKITIDVTKSENYAVVTIIDTGVGIPRKDQERIFKKFERTDIAAELDSGSGLGLPLVKSLIELHGGHITINSKPKVGTTVVCQLPLSLPLSAQQELPKIA